MWLYGERSNGRQYLEAARPPAGSSAKKDHDVARVYSYPPGPPRWDRFLYAEVWTSCGLVTYYILFFIQVASRRVHIAGMTPHPMGHG